ncbi:MAG: UGSC family (seleno)protein, partial [Natronomonas sp.]|nr:UGSC family (seleno)protein [Natronomonas sp.]
MADDTNTITIDGDFDDANDYLYRHGMTDGLPVVPPTAERVNRMLMGTYRDPDEELGTIPPKYGVATVQKLATNAVMAGCKPEYMPVLIAAVEAMTR